VEENWKSLEFTVIPHHYYSSIYILGGTEDIQQVIDDSFINMYSIASSRHVSHIKPQMDEWLWKLDLFSNTLVSG
jgi:dynein heavy chain